MGFSPGLVPDDKGDWFGFDVDFFAVAVASAIFG
jgi:hypothetical protein